LTYVRCRFASCFHHLVSSLFESVAEVRFGPVPCHISANTEHEHPPVWVNRIEDGPNTKALGSCSNTVQRVNYSKVSYMVDNSLVLLHYFVLYKYESLRRPFKPICFVFPFSHIIIGSECYESGRLVGSLALRRHKYSSDTESDPTRERPIAVGTKGQAVFVRTF
jgi:hypothetical protein